MGSIGKLVALVSEYPDSPQRRRILTSLGDLNEQMNGFLFGIASTQGYTFKDKVIYGGHGGSDGEEVIRKDTES